jgi:transposase
MRKKLPFIKESTEQLQQKLKAEKDVQKRQRIQALYLIKSGQVKSRLEVAEVLSVHRHTVGAWLNSYEKGGLECLLTIAKAPGKIASVRGTALVDLKQREPKGFSSYGEIKSYLEKEHKVKLAYSAVHSALSIRSKAQVSTSLSSKKKPEETIAFIQDLPAQLAKIASRASQQGYKNVCVWVEDESRVGLIPTPSHHC